MSYNQVLETQIDEIATGWEGMGKKKMFGGVCYLLHGNMCVGILKDYLIVRLSAAEAAERLQEKHVIAFDLTGRPMKGWVMVEEGAWSNRKALKDWINRGKAFALSLPPKPPREKSLEEIYYKTR